MHKQAAAVTIVIILAALLLPAGGCGGGGGAGTIKLLDLAEPAGFAIYYPVTASVQPSLPAQPIDPRLAGVTGLDAASLPPAAASLLARNGFALTPGRPGGIAGAYRQVEAPVFVTLDSLAFAFQSLSSQVLAGLERDRLQSDLHELTSAMLEMSGSFEQAAGERGKEAARANQEFFGVAARLLDPGAELPDGVEEVVSKEVLLIATGAGVSESPVFGYQEDYRRYVPQGSYALGEDAARYFQAVTWYGNMGMRLRPAGSAQMRETGRRETRQAILAVGGLHLARVGEESALETWERLYQVIRFFGAGWDDLDVYDYTTLLAETYGREFPLSRLESDSELDGFIDKALELRRQRVSSQGLSGVEGEESAGLSFLSRNNLPDEYILDELTDPEVEGRFFPRGLDVAAALGSARAREINLALYDDARFPGYETRLEELRRALLTLGTQVTAGSVYWNQLYALKQMLVTPGAGFPAFMSNQAWAERCLYAFLGAWTALRRETAAPDLRDSAAVDGSAAAPDIPGYVEPVPEALARMVAMVDVMRRGLEERRLLGPDAGQRLDALYSLLSSLKTMAEKELRNQPFSEEEATLLLEFPERLEYVSRTGAAGAEPVTSGLPRVTAVHDDPVAMEALEEAVGYPVTYHVIVPYQGGLYYTQGAGLSYYEFKQPLDLLLNDEAWRAMLEAGQAPGAPAWSESFLAY